MVVGFLLIIFYSCKKEEDNSIPSIHLSKPLANQQFSAGDTILIAGEITDDQKIAEVTVKILNQNLISASTTDYFYPGSNHFSLSHHFPIPEGIPSGNYFLTITANDGTNNKSLFLEIQIDGMPLELERIFVVTGNESSARFERVEQGSTVPFSGHQSDFSGAAIDGASNILGMAGSYNGPLVFLSTTNADIISTTPSLGSSGSLYFSGLQFNRRYNHFTAGYAEGFVKILNSQLQEAGQLYVQGNFVPYDIFEDDWRYFVEEKSIISPETRMGIYFKPVGALDQHVFLGQDVKLKGVFRKNMDEYYVFLNENGIGKLKLFNISNGSFSFPAELPEGEIKDIIEIDPGVFVLGMGGELYRYTYSSNNIAIIAQVEVQVMEYDLVNQKIVCGSGNSLIWVDPFSGAQSMTVPAGDQILEILLDYSH